MEALVKKPSTRSKANKPQNVSTKKKSAKHAPPHASVMLMMRERCPLRSATQPQKLGPTTRISCPNESSTPICAAASPSDARYKLKYGAAAPTWAKSEKEKKKRRSKPKEEK